MQLVPHEWLWFNEATPSPWLKGVTKGLGDEEGVGDELESQSTRSGSELSDSAS